MPALLLRLWKPLTGAAFLALAAGAILFYGHAREQAGEARIMAMWSQDLAARRAADEALRAAEKARFDKARALNEEIEREYQEKLGAVAADRDSTFRLLQQARNQVRAVTAREATSALIAATAGEAAVAERVDQAVAGVVAESRANADQLDALIATVKPQL